MRNAFHDQLDAIFEDLAAIGRLVEAAVEQATRSLLTADAALAEQVISADADIDRARERVEDDAFQLLSLQAPVAGDLRVVVAALRMVTELERMGDLAAHVAKIARLRYPEIAVPPSLRANFVRMGDVAEKMVVTAGQTLNDRNIQNAQELRSRDEEMDELRRTQFRLLLSDDWSDGVEAAVDVALLGRYYERIADHAVSIANRVVFVVTGQTPQEAGVV